jgi:MoxR-like ATPase
VGQHVDGVSAESVVRRLVEAVPPPRVATGHPEYATDLAAA